MLGLDSSVLTCDTHVLTLMRSISADEFLNQQTHNDISMLVVEHHIHQGGIAFARQALPRSVDATGVASRSSH